MARQSVTITTLPRSPEADRHARMVRYMVTMGIRIICIILCMMVKGWWLLLCAAGAIFLPYVAVILANVVDSTRSDVESPGSMTPMIEQPMHEEPGGSDEATAL